MRKVNPYALILAGGRGTRFWPRSRIKTPKQLLTFLGERTLLQDTVDRLLPLVPAERIWILTNDHLRDDVIAQLPEVPTRQVLAEPAQRNTAPCLGLAAHLIRIENPNAVLGVFPADHYILRPARFRSFAKPAFTAAEQGKLVTIGIQPRWPETGYGYLEFPRGVKVGGKKAVELKRFREKPDLAAAKRFVRAGRFFWNAGMFFWKAETFLDALRRYLPKTASLLASLPGVDDSRFGGALERVYPQCEDISVDFAVMEKAATDGMVAGLAADEIGWNDLGSWNAVYDLLHRDEAGNTLRTATVTSDDVAGCYVDAPGKLVALVGVKDLVIVDTPDALLVADRNRTQEVGPVVKELEKMGRRDLV